MSLILEALKKSEQQRRLGEAPTLGSPMLAVRGKRSLLPLIGILVAIAIATYWWLRPAPTTAPTAAPIAAAPVASSDTTTQAPPMNRVKPTPAHTAPTRSAEAKREPAKPMASGMEAVAPPLPIAPPINDRPGSVTQLPPPPVATAATAAAPPAAHQPAATPASSERSKAAALPPATAPATPTAVAANAATATPPGAPAAAVPHLPSVWELPYATRKDLPDLTLTMHVYAPDPHERFVVIKGERHVEGDDLGDGVILREISADGMVLDYKGTRFVYPRGP